MSFSAISASFLCGLCVETNFNAEVAEFFAEAAVEFRVLCDLFASFTIIRGTKPLHAKAQRTQRKEGKNLP